MQDIGIETRKIVLDRSIRIEKMLSDLLGDLLGIESKTSDSFGNKNCALSLNAKVLLLKDMNIIDSEDREKLQLFMEIRNQFIHNFDVKSFLLCTMNISKNLKIKYRYDNNEAELKRLFFELCSDIQLIFNKVIDFAGKQYGEKALSIWRTEALEKIVTNAKALEKEIDDLFKTAQQRISVTYHSELQKLQSDINTLNSKNIYRALFGSDPVFELPQGILDELNIK